jgi:hypothetical protein
MPTTIVAARVMPVITTVVRSSRMRGKAGGKRPSPPLGIISRRRRRSGVIPDHWSPRTTDFFNRFFYQLSVLPNPFPHFLAIEVIGPLRNGLNGMSAFIKINHRLAILGCISGCLIILINRIADQSTKNSSRSQSD